MSTDQPITAELLPLAKPAPSRWERVEKYLVVVSDRLNPILVKETRQSLKSTQFALTFFLLLTGGWLWSLYGVASHSPEIYYRALGPDLLIVYFVGLAFPLMVIVPFVAFRSLVAEREDGTYELLSISTLSARQIISGKLGSAMLQMMVYLSALAPCLAFTYLLRGIDIVTIALLLGLVVGLCLFLASAGILIGTVTRVRHWNTVLSVFIILGLVLAYWVFAAMFLESLWYGGLGAPSDDVAFWRLVGVLASAALGYVVLMLTAATARITFKSENRSAPLRWVMLAMQAGAVGWTIDYALAYKLDDALIGLCTWSAFNWVVFGMFVNGEASFLSDRVRRRLPQTFLGRTLFTWMNPGARTGYVFVLSSLGAAMLFVCLIWLVARPLFGQMSTLNDTIIPMFALVAWAYVAIYLSLGHWLIAGLRKLVRIDMVTGAIIQPILLFIGIVGPLILQFAIFRDNNYTPLQITNPFWTLVEIIDDHRYRQYAGGFETVVAVLVVLAGGIAFLTHLMVCLRDITFVRVTVPQRVREEEKRLAPQAEPVRTSPWDDAAAEEQPRG